METPQPPPATPPTRSHPRRSAQFALAAVFVALLGLLAFRGYGNRLGARPTDAAPPAPAVDLNRADRAELEQVPGVGPKLAQAIDAHRREKGPFRSVDDLRQVHGFGPRTIDKVRPFLRVEESSGEPPRSPDPEPVRLERKPPPPPAALPRGATRKLQPGDPPVNVNTASLDELQMLPGVGPVTAQKIMDARTAASFKTADELRRVKGIGPKTLEGLRAFVVVK
jgi:competence protein ComEA